MDLSILVKILLGGYLTLWRISRGYLQEMTGVKIPCWNDIWGIIWYYQQI